MSKNNPHAILVTHQNAHTTNLKLDAHGGTRVHSSTQAKPGRKPGKGTTATNNFVLSTIDLEENWRTTNKEAVQSSILSQCRNALLYSRERDKDYRKELSSEEPAMIAIRTRPYFRGFTSRVDSTV